MTPIYKEIALSYSFPSLEQKDCQAAVVWLLKLIVSGASEYVHNQILPDLFLLPSYEPTIWVKGLDYLLGPETATNTTVNIWLWFLVYYFWLELLSKYTKVKLLYPVAWPHPYPLDSLLRLVITTKWWIGITLSLLQGKIYIDRQTNI